MTNQIHQTDFNEFTFTVDKQMLATLKYGLGLIAATFVTGTHLQNTKKLLLVIDGATRENSFTKTPTIELCEKCGGSGLSRKVNDEDNYDKIACPRCDGTGRVKKTVWVFMQPYLNQHD